MPENEFLSGPLQSGESPSDRESVRGVKHRAVLAFVLLELALIVSVRTFPRCRLVPIQGGLLPQRSSIVQTGQGIGIESGRKVISPGLQDKVFVCPDTQSALNFARARGWEVISVHTDTSGPGDRASAP
jgi:hypothetical protein